MSNQVPKINRRWTQQSVLDEIKKLTTLSAKSVQRSTPSLYGAAVRKFGSWKKAVEAAGFEYSSTLKRKAPGSWNRETVTAEIQKCTQKSSGFIRKNRPDLYNAALRLYGSWETAIQAAQLDYGSIRKNRIKKDPPS